MNGYGGFIFVIDEPERASTIREYVERNESFTDVISAPDWHPREAEIVLVSLGDDSLAFAALARRGHLVATRKRRIRRSDFVAISPALPLNELRDGVSPQLRQYFVRASTGNGRRVPPATWLQVLDNVRRLRPAAAEGLDRLDRLRRAPIQVVYGPAENIVAEERDAVNLAMRMAGIELTNLLSWQDTNSSRPHLCAAFQECRCEKTK